jgi:magnesium transporter
MVGAGTAARRVRSDPQMLGRFADPRQSVDVGDNSRVTERLTHDHLNDLLFGYLRRDFTALNVNHTVGAALDRLRVQPLGERIVYFYVVDDDERVVGVLPTRRLLMADPGKTIGSIMVSNVLTLPTSATVRDASEAFVRHRLLALPVVDAGGHLHGVADVSLFTGDISDTVARAAAQDVFQMIGLHLSRSAKVWKGFLDRFPWLLANITGGLVAAIIATAYEHLLNAMVVLALFMPVVLALSESISMQSVTLTLQSMRNTRVDWPFLRLSLRRELVTALMLGAGCGLLIGLVALAWKRQVLVAAVMAGTVPVSMVAASLFGVMLPGALHALHRDPRIASGPIVLALADFATLIVYFNVATLLLR